MANTPELILQRSKGGPAVVSENPNFRDFSESKMLPAATNYKDKPLIVQYFRTIPERRSEVNLKPLSANPDASASSG